MNIAAWASKDEKVKGNSRSETIDSNNLEGMEYAKRAAAWEEAEKSKHATRFKREEIKIQAWESQQKAKLEAKMRKIEVKMNFVALSQDGLSWAQFKLDFRSQGSTHLQ